MRLLKTAITKDHLKETSERRFTSCSIRAPASFKPFKASAWEVQPQQTPTPWCNSQRNRPSKEAGPPTANPIEPKSLPWQREQTWRTTNRQHQTPKKQQTPTNAIWQTNLNPEFCTLLVFLLFLFGLLFHLLGWGLRLSFLRFFLRILQGES